MKTDSNDLNNVLNFVISDAQKMVNNRRYTEKIFRSRIQMTKEQYWDVFRAYAYALLRKRGYNTGFEVDDNNRDILRQLFLYTCGYPECEWPLSKGFILAGNPGVGKTLTMNTFLLVYNKVCEGDIESIHVKDLVSNIKKAGSIDKYTTGRLFIDELGRETKLIKDFGNEITPIVDLIAARYERNSITYFTTNFEISDLQKFYGNYIVERLKEMCVFVVQKGKSRRPNLGEICYGK